MQFRVANAENLEHIPSDSLDLYTIAFCIRNVTNRQKALKEAHRVLRKGGRFMCLEVSEVQIPVFKEIYDHWLMTVVPGLGDFVGKDRETYQYMSESIKNFPKQT